MNSTFVYIIIIILILCVLIFANNKRNTNKKLNNIRSEWNSAKCMRDKEPFESVRSYWDLYKNRNGTFIDDITWEDLTMDSVFNRINYTHTSIGAEKLYSIIRTNNLTERYFEKEESFIQELAQDDSLREKIELSLARLGKKNFTATSSFLYSVSNKLMKYPIIYVLFSLLPIISLSLFLYNPKIALILFISFILLNAFIYYSRKRWYEQHFYSLDYIVSIVNCAKRLSKIKHTAFNSKGIKISKDLSKLKTISRWGSIISSSNGSVEEVMLDYIKVFFLIDFIAYNRILKKIKSNQEEYASLWHMVSDLDSMISIAYVRNSFKDHCIPEFEKEMYFQAVDIYHPLIKDPVKNSVEFQKDILITGSNASGKSTFIKTLAINCILAQTINTALAKKLILKPSYILTSMAISDNVLTGDSYFIAEIKSLKRIIDTISRGVPCITFIDEILKGTNTIERISASAAILKWIINKENNLNVLASHDLELTEITKGYLENYHFREIIEKDSITFDYKLKEGPSYTKNAIKLLDKLEYPDEIIGTASNLATNFVENGDWLTLSRFQHKT